METLAPAIYVRQAIAQFAAAGTARAELFEAAGASPDALNEQAGRLPLAVQFRLIASLNAMVGRGWLLDAPAVWSPTSQGLLDVAVRSAPTLAKALETLARFAPARAPELEVSIRKAGRSILVRLQVVPAPDAAPPPEVAEVICEAAVLSAHAMLAAFVGDASDAVSFAFPWPRPHHADRLRQTLAGAHLRFDAPACEMQIDARLSGAVSPQSDPEVFALAVANLETLILPGGRDAPRRAAARLIGENPALTAADVARRLGMSERTLVRRLAETGAGFRALRDSVLKDMAARMIAEGRLDRAAIAERLGYGDPTSFSRACRRWFGQSYRDRKDAARGVG